MAAAENAAREAAPAWQRTLRLAGWNALLLLAGLALIGVAGEAYWRLRTPFTWVDRPFIWSPTIGRAYAPNVEVRFTNYLDFWVESRTNSLGFLDREPIGVERAAASCHVAVIGDSFVEALQVPIADRFHVRLEEMAARELPRLDVTTSAFASAAPAKSANWLTTTSSRGISAPPWWCSSSSPTTSRTIRQSWMG